MIDRRKFVRVPARLETRYWLAGQPSSQARQTWSEDIAEGGIRLCVNESLPVGQEVWIVFLENDHRLELSELNGIVAWQKDSLHHPSTSSIDTGVSFSSTDPTTKSRLQKWLLKGGTARLDFAETDEITDLGSAYDSSTVTFQVLRTFGWGPLINLGYFRFPAPFSALNLLYNLALLKTTHMLPSAQVRLVRKSSKLLDIQANDDVLDLACGRGFGSFLMASSYPTSNVTGIDLLPENIQVASALYGNVRNLRFEHGNALNLQFSDGSFDKVLCIEAAFQFASRERFLREAFRVLKRGGRLVVVDFVWKTDEDRRVLEDELTRFVQCEWKWSDFFSLNQYIKSAKSAEFEVQGIHRWSRKVTGPIQFIFSTLAETGRWSWSRAAVSRFNPLLRSLTDNEWTTLRHSAKAHNHVRRHVEYVALVLEK